MGGETHHCPGLAADHKGAVLFAGSLVTSTVSAIAIVTRDRAERSTDTSAKGALITLGLFHVAIGIGIAIRFA
ncbi:MAG: hypothetical protein QM831_37545 [Kofleriaceae bacterium]